MGPVYPSRRTFMGTTLGDLTVAGKVSGIIGGTIHGVNGSVPSYRIGSHGRAGCAVQLPERELHLSKRIERVGPGRPSMITVVIATGVSCGKRASNPRQAGAQDQVRGPRCEFRGYSR